jgi:multidrug efflux pump subunit AcrB/outer membrane protein TolC
MNFVRTSLKNKQVTLTVLAMVFAVGVYSLLTMPRREDPKITVPLGLVIAYYPGATAAQVEEQVTKKLEQYLFQFEEVKKTRTYSTTRDGVVIINVQLNDDVKKPDIFWDKLRHQLYLAKNLDLPEGVRGPVVNSDFGDTEAVLIAIEGENTNYEQLKEYSKQLENRLRTVPAASKIKRIGEQKEQISVYFNSQSLSQYGISLQQVVKVLQSQNTVSPTGEIQTGDNKVALYTSGTYNSQNEIENQVIGTSKSGDVVRLKDIATFKRENAEATSNIAVNGHMAMIVSVQMQEGNNIVWFGKDISKKIEEASMLLPANVKLTTIFSQPRVVDENISHFMHEFLLAIISVIIVVILLLPFRIAAVAATAIPMTIAVTFALLHMFGIELHQVSLAALIVVLGMVVDDAIVVADNYVDLLDKGVERWTAAWRSAFDLTIPILTATVTIIASFMPMIILPGAIGEFIHDLPITVTIALASSFIVAMVLTPILCFVFIKKGLHHHSEDDKARQSKKSLLNYMQNGYNKAIDWCAKHHALTIWGSIFTIVLAFMVFKTFVGQRFFPYAERNQFVVEIWMPTGTKLDKTKAAVSEIENLIKNDKRVTSFASFSGASAPRVYYNFSPEFPVTNYGQVLINTTSNETTEELAKELERKVAAVLPAGTVQVKLMQQGQVLIAPVEIHIFGDDMNTLKRLGNEVKTILHNTEGNYFVNDDFKEDFYGISIQLKDEASRLGFTTSSISQVIYANVSGAPVTTMYETDNAIDIVLRLDENKRQSYQDIENIYIESPVTGASVPLRQIADIKPGWQTGRIMHRNGVRCLTVRSETNNNVLPAELLEKIRPEIAKLNLPAGYYIEYGGEYANKEEVTSKMIVALGISLVLIFLILLLQFRNLKETAIIMITIPLSLFGATFGLAVTGNNFGFTAFVGLISLSGIVVRNAIILIDHTNELIEKGLDVRAAAIEAGKRRLRPIFLTAMAAAIGVLPMILSGSSLWSPLASVIAFGVTWSMVMSLLTVPVLYIMIVKPEDKQHHNHENGGANISKAGAVALLIVGLLMTTPTLNAQQAPEKLSLQKIQEMAIQNNHYLKIKQMQVNEKQEKINQDRVKYFPVVSVGGNYQYNSNLPQLTIDKGSFGTLPLQYIMQDGSIQNVTVELPAEDKTMNMGKNNTYNASATFYQPISQIPQIKEGVNVSKTELAITQAEQNKATMQIKQAAEKMYFGLLILQKQKEEAELKKTVAQSKLNDAESAVMAGKATNSAQIGLNANLADEEQNLLKINIQISDYTADLKQLIGMPDTVVFALDSFAISTGQLFNPSMDSITNEAQLGNVDLKMAGLTLSKAEYAIKASRYSYIPELGVFGGYTYQEGNTLYPANNTFVGVSLKWNIQDMFTTTYTKRQRVYQRIQAEENIANTKEQVGTDVAKAYRHLSQSMELIAVAQKVTDFRREDLKIQSDKQTSGLNISSDYLTAKAALAKAEADLYAAHLNYRMAYTDIQILTGKY